jgi:exopolyphosphatase/guanosine-5'-triphosphate,3'-diphosphate pyrophosphatase
MSRYAAFDIGSNSVRMLTADTMPGRTQILASDREVTRLGESVYSTGFIAREAMSFVCDVLRRMADEARHHDVVATRAVATAAVRDASNQDEFLDRASLAIGAPVEVISGQEEARLIHLGVEARWPHAGQRILIVDVGGGSAELIVGEHRQLRHAFSRPVGAVRLANVFVRHDPPTTLEVEQMREFIDEKLSFAFKEIDGLSFDRAIATSSTAAALVCAANRIPRPRREEADRLRATLPQVRKLFGNLSKRTAEERARIPGIGPRRAQIIVPGVAVLLQCMERFRLPALYYSTAGVRDGIVADLASRRVGAERSQLTREQRHLVEQMASKYGLDLRHVRKVTSFCHLLFSSLRGLHGLAPDWGKVLEAAATLYDIGHFVSDTGHHKHSQYLVANSDLPGFTDREKLLISLLCRFHRKSMPGQRHAEFNELAADDRKNLLLLIPILRLAEALDIGNEQRVEEIDCDVTDSSIKLGISAREKAELEEWASRRVSDLFEDIYGRPLALVRK